MFWAQPRSTAEFWSCLATVQPRDEATAHAQRKSSIAGYKGQTEQRGLRRMVETACVQRKVRRGERRPVVMATTRVPKWTGGLAVRTWTGRLRERQRASLAGLGGEDSAYDQPKPLLFWLQGVSKKDLGERKKKFCYWPGTECDVAQASFALIHLQLTT